MNRKKTIELFISNIANAILHELLEKAIDNIEITEKYHKEIANSRNIAKIYRERINPINSVLHSKNVLFIRKKIINKVKNELLVRISKGYQNLNTNLVENFVDKFLRELRVM